VGRRSWRGKDPSQIGASIVLVPASTNPNVRENILLANIAGVSFMQNQLSLKEVGFVFVRQIVGQEESGQNNVVARVRIGRAGASVATIIVAYLSMVTEAGDKNTAL
jgi:alkylation response protein AidB-like acyl-CoA dehydrogenase